MKKTLLYLLTLVLVLSLCSGCGIEENIEETSSESANIYMEEADFSQTDETMFTERDRKTEYDENNSVAINLNKTSATASSDSVTISGSTVTITEEATYIISGELSNGMLIVNAPDSAKLHLVFDGVSITSETSAALYILEAEKVFITLVDGTDNALVNSGSFIAIDENNIDAVLFSKQDLTLNGGGSLTVTSPAGHGVVCKDDLVITGGSYTINSASHGLAVNDSVRIDDADITIDAGKDGIHAENNDDTSLGFIYISSGNINAEAEGDGISAGAHMQIVNATIHLLVGGGCANRTKEKSESFGGFMGEGRGGGMPSGDMRPEEMLSVDEEESGSSMKGLKSINSMLISGGNITIDSADDAVHSDASIIINGGNFTIATGDDAIHAEDRLTITSGSIDVSESYEGLEALHIEVRGGDIKLAASDDGMNAAGGVDQSGTAGDRDGMFGGGAPKGAGGQEGVSANTNGSIIISGGNIYIKALGDGLDANGTIEVSGGDTVVVGPTQGDTAILDYDISGTISGGTFIGTGALGMTQSFGESNQCFVALNAGNQPSGTKIMLKDSEGEALIDCVPELGFTVVILSSSDVVKGETYTITIGEQTVEWCAE